MLHVENNDEIEQLRQMSHHFDGDFKQSYKSARFIFDNDKGIGHISTYQVFPGLVSKSYDVNLAEELKFTKNEKEDTPFYFVYCVKGYFFHKYKKEESFKKISQNQNVVLQGKDEEEHEIVLPSGVDLQISIIFVSLSKFGKIDVKKANRFESVLRDFFEKFELNDKGNHFGEINPGTSQFAKILVKNRRMDAIGMLITEGALLNTLASQLLNHEKFYKTPIPKLLSIGELNKIIDLGTYIVQNISTKISVNDLAKRIGLSPKKLQYGCNYLYGESVANLIQRLRVENARQLLQNTELTVSEVCYRVGYSSRSYFSKVFKENFDILPSDYRLSINQTDIVYELCYKSKKSKSTSIPDIENIVSESILNNLNHSISGSLVFFSDIFFQIIEGSKSEILTLYEKIKRDTRHFDVTLIWQGVKRTRTFGDWSMAFLSENENIDIASTSARLTYHNIKELMEGMEDSDLFSDILWRRVLTILKTAS